MAERFGSQTHPSGGVRFGSQTYSAISSSAGDLAAVESGLDVFDAEALPGAHSDAILVESVGADIFDANGTSSLLHTLQAHEDPTLDAFHAQGIVVNGSLRFGSATHPLGGLRFGSQQWAALGPNGPLALTESGADAFAAAGFQVSSAYVFAAYDILASFVTYSSESLAPALTGTLDNGYKVMLPVSGPGVAFTWELNEFANPSLRLANFVGASQLTGIPWFIWNGSGWTQGVFDISDAIQGAIFLLEVGDDTASFNGSETHYGDALLVESGGDDFTVLAGSVIVTGALAAAEFGTADTFAASGSAFHVGDANLVEGAVDVLNVSASLIASGSVAMTEQQITDELDALGQVAFTGSLAATETGADTFAASGARSATGSLDATETAGADTFAAAAALQVTGDLAVAELGQDVFAAAGALERIGAADLHESGVDLASIAGLVAIAGAAAANETDADRFYSVGVRGFAGSLDAIEQAVDRMVARGLTRDLPVVPDFAGSLTMSSATEQFTVESRQQAAAA